MNKLSVATENESELPGQSRSAGLNDTVALAAMRSVESALKNGEMTFTELDDAGAILMLSQRDEMLTINVTAAWLVSRLQYGGDEANMAQEFAAHFAIPIHDAATDIQRFFLQLATALN